MKYVTSPFNKNVLYIKILISGQSFTKDGVIK